MWEHEFRVIIEFRHLVEITVLHPVVSQLPQPFPVTVPQFPIHLNVSRELPLKSDALIRQG